MKTKIKTLLIILGLFLLSSISLFTTVEAKVTYQDEPLWVLTKQTGISEFIESEPKKIKDGWEFDVALDKSFRKEISKTNSDKQLESLFDKHEKKINKDFDKQDKKLDVDDFVEKVKKLDKYPVWIKVYDMVPVEILDDGKPIYFTDDDGHTETEVDVVETLIISKSLGYLDVKNKAKDKFKVDKKLIPDSGWAEIEIGFDSISYVGGTNNYIKVYCSGAGDDGESWVNPMSFQKIVDYFETNPMSSIDMPASGDIIEKTEWTTGWMGGTYTTATVRSNNGDATIEVADTTGFTATGDVHSIYGTAEYPDYQRYTSLDATNLFGCTWDKYWGLYETARADTNNVIYQVTNATTTWNTTDYKVGSESVQYNHTGGNNAIITRDFMTQDGTYYGLSNVNAYCAMTVSFWMKVNNSNTKLKQVETRVRYSTNGRIFSYGTVWDNNSNGWGFNADTWTQVNITIRDGTRRSSRDWWSAISNVVFLFEDMTASDVIKIDGLKFHLENPNPYEITPNAFLFPLKIYNSNGWGGNDFYFYDYGKTIIWNHLSLNMMYFRSTGADQINMRLGEKGGAETGINIFGNNWAFDENNYNIDFEDSGHDETFQLNGFNFMGAHGRCGGINYKKGSKDSANSEIRNSNLYHISDFMESQGQFGIIENLGLHGGRYLPRVSTAGTISNWNIWCGGNSWITGTYRTMNYQANFEGVTFVSVIGTVNLIDCNFYFNDALIALGAGEIFNIGYSFNLKVIDEDGNDINSASVVVKDKDGNNVFTTTTNSNGYIISQDVNISRWNIAGTKHYNNPDVSFNPFNITITKAGYQTYNTSFNIAKSTNWTVALLDKVNESSALFITGGGTDIVLVVTVGTVFLLLGLVITVNHNKKKQIKIEKQQRIK